MRMEGSCGLDVGGVKARCGLGRYSSAFWVVSSRAGCSQVQPNWLQREEAVGSGDDVLSRDGRTVGDGDRDAVPTTK